MLLGTFHQTLHLKGWTFSQPGHPGSQASRKWTFGGHSYSQAIAGGKKEKKKKGRVKKERIEHSKTKRLLRFFQALQVA